MVLVSCPRLVVVACGALAACRFEPGVRGDGGVGRDGPPTDSRRDAGPLDPDGAMDAEVPDAPAHGIAFVQEAVALNNGNNDSVSVTLAAPQIAGNLNVVVASWTSGNNNVSAITDTAGNTYMLAVGLVANMPFSQSIYYAANIVDGPNTITMTLTGKSPNPKIRVFEYAGLATADPIASGSNSGNSDESSVPSLPVSQVPALVFAANVAAIATTGPGPGFTLRQLDDGDIAQDRIVIENGDYGTTAPLLASDAWIMHAVAFRAAP